MCFYKKKINQKMRRATRNIVVYKVLDEIKSSDDLIDEIDLLLVSPIYTFIWELGKTYQAKEKIDSRKRTYRITKGVFHSYNNLEIAKSSILKRNTQVFKAIIPKGTYYMRGENNETVSKYLRIVKRII